MIIDEKHHEPLVLAQLNGLKFCVRIQIMLNAKLIEQGWALQPSLVNKRINLGTTSAQIINLALKERSSDVIRPMHCLTSLKILAELRCHQGTFSAASVCLLFLECPTLFYELWLNASILDLFQKLRWPRIQIPPRAAGGRQSA